LLWKYAQDQNAADRDKLLYKSHLEHGRRYRPLKTISFMESVDKLEKDDSGVYLLYVVVDPDTADPSEPDDSVSSPIDSTNISDTESDDALDSPNPFNRFNLPSRSDPRTR
jgi:hypothetical protein